MLKKVILYTAESCPWCQKAKKFLKENNIEFEEKDVANPINAKEVVEKSGQGGIPVIDIDGQIVIGYNEKKLRELLGI